MENNPEAMARQTSTKEIKRRAKRKFTLKLKANIPLFVLLLPSLILLLYLPMYGLIMAFKGYSPALGIMDSP